MNLTPDDLIEALQVVQGWHTRNMGIIDSMIDSMIDSEAVAVRIEGVGKPVRLEGDTLKGFKVGLIVAKELIGSLPFNLTEDEQEQNLNSDKLRRQLDENNESMNTLADDNQRIVELLADRGLRAVEPISQPLKKNRVTLGEILAGGWWCAESGKRTKELIRSAGLLWLGSANTYASDAGIGCMSSELSRLAARMPVSEINNAHLKQIHRIGNNFYWGAASDQEN